MKDKASEPTVHQDVLSGVPPCPSVYYSLRVLIHSLKRAEEIGRIHANVYDLNPPGNSEKLVRHVLNMFSVYLNVMDYNSIS